MTGRARVFISCGQAKLREKRIAEEIKSFLENEMNYEVAYVLGSEQSTESIREAICESLKACEYFLFIDFRRELILKKIFKREKYRGSLYSHQEIAIASFLELPIIAFVQKGVLKNDGMVSTMKINPIYFKRPSEIIDRLEKEIKTRQDLNWDPNHRNELSIGISDKTEETYRWTDENGQRHKINLLIHGLRVENKSKYAHARGCAAFLSRVEPDKAIAIHPPIYNLKWSESKISTSYIFKESNIILAAVCIDKNNPSRAFLYKVVDLQDILEPIEGPGEFILEYTVVSENFSTVKAEFKLTLGAELINSKFELIRTNLPG